LRQIRYSRKLKNRNITGTSLIEVPVMDVNGSGHRTRLDSLAIEEPLEIRIGGMPISITMRTPGHDEELAVGFLFGEGLIRSGDQIRSLSAGDPDDPDARNVVTVELENEVGFEFERLERHFYTTSSCGVCGKGSIEALEVFPRLENKSGLTVERSVIRGLPTALSSSQDLFRETGGLHAAAVFSPDGHLVDLREDVGRHNAMDKLVGSMVLDDDIPVGERIVLVSGRASFELVQKALMAGFPIMAAVGAPSSLAVELASWYGLTLIGFLREDRFNVYTKPKRIAGLLETEAAEHRSKPQNQSRCS
jgi:FdhD protein